MNSSPSHASKPGFSFPGWSPALAADDSLSAGLREAYRQILSRFLKFSAQRRAGPSVAVAREFIELARLEQSPSPARLQEWKAALNWFFRRGREVSAVLLKGVPPLARSDLGSAAWEAALIAYLRQRGRSWRTEQTYRGWMWRFVKWLGSPGRRKSTPHPPCPHPQPLSQSDWARVASDQSRRRGTAREGRSPRHRGFNLRTADGLRSTQIRPVTRSAVNSTAHSLGR
jgi:hypothetical protein